MRSTLKCDIIVSLYGGIVFMKTKIIYISGNEVFNINDIRSAFEEVRLALNLDKDTVLFGVPVDQEDAGLSHCENMAASTQNCTIDEVCTKNVQQVVEQETPEIITPDPENIIAEQETQITESTITEIKEQAPIKKRGRSNKEKTEVIEDTDSQIQETKDEKVVPILSVLSSKPEEQQPIVEETEIQQEQIEIVHQEEVAISITDDIDETQNESEMNAEDEEPDLEKLLSEMTPLHEDINDNLVQEEPIQDVESSAEEESVDATLEQLAAEFAESQDKIATETKHSSRSKIGKLRNILPFKQSKHKDQGLGDLFGWAGVAANDEDFSVPGFFTNAVGKK